jgi:hypothetical protein
MSQYPTQTRAVDPFASYDSDTVNTLTRMATQGEDLLFSPRGMDVIADSTSPNDYVNITEGSCFKDDVWIQITAEHQVDFNNALHYFGGSIIKEPGYYYIVLEYEFVKSRPSPQASIKIIPPSLVATGYGTNHIFLKAITATTGPWALGTFYDYDPGDTTIYRENTSTWASVEHTLPTFSQTRDQGRIIHVRDEDMYYFGILNSWERLDKMGTRITMITSSDLNSLVYYDGTSWVDAIASSETTFAQAVVTEVGINPKGRWAGSLTVRVQAAATISAGEFVYLSSSESGTATNVKTNQQVGVALTSGSGTITILFFPSASVSGNVKSQLNSWNVSGSDYYEDIDISVLSPALISDAFAVQCWDNSTGELLDPMLVDRTALNTIRIWMPVNTVTLNVIVTG